MLITAKTLTFKVTILSLTMYDITAAFFGRPNKPFAIRFFLAGYNICPVAIPEIYAQTQGSDYWQLTHCFCVCICEGIRPLLLGAGIKQAWTLC